VIENNLLIENLSFIRLKEITASISRVIINFFKFLVLLFKMSRSIDKGNDESDKDSERFRSRSRDSVKVLYLQKSFRYDLI